jgi:hypothetical protein
MRVTVAEVNHKLERLNHLLGLHQKPVSSIDGNLPVQLQWNYGTYFLDSAYGGLKLVRVHNEHGGTQEVTKKRMTKKEIWYILDSIENVLESIKIESLLLNNTCK